jgi:hypothetical protein
MTQLLGCFAGCFLTKQRLGKAVYVYMIDLDDPISIAQSGCDAVDNVFVAGTCVVLGVWRRT